MSQSYYGEPDPRSFLLEVAKGNIPGHSLKILRGNNIDLDDGVAEDLWEQGGTIAYLSSAETMNMVSSSTDDDVAGTGALTLLLEGTDSAGAYQSEIIILTGQVNKLSASAYLRINSMTILTAGSGGVNAGAITATASSAASVQDKMAAGEGASQSSHYMIPTGRRAFLYQFEINGARIGQGGGTPTIEFKGFIIPSGGARIQAFDKIIDTSVGDTLDVKLPFPTPLGAGTQIKITAESDINNTIARSRMYLLEVLD